jgi:hypothetical protein
MNADVSQLVSRCHGSDTDDGARKQEVEGREETWWLVVLGTVGYQVLTVLYSYSYEYVP